MARIVLVANAVVWFVIGVWALVDPAGVAGFSGFAPLGPAGTLEIRAMYGGMSLGLGTFLVWCAADPTRWRVGLVAAIATVGGLGVTRLTWIALDPPQPALHMAFAALELTATCVAVVALVRSR